MISPIAPVSMTQATSATSAVSGMSQNSGASFGDLLSNALDQVNGLENNAANLATSYASGQNVPVDQLMIAEQQADLGVNLVVQVRDRVVSAYQTFMNMQV